MTKRDDYYRLYADNQLRITEISEAECPAIEQNKEIQAELTKLDKFVEGFDETAE